MRVFQRTAVRRSLSALAIIGPTLAGVAGSARAATETATATIKLADGSEAGTVTLIASTAGVLLKLNLKGLSPGLHAVRVYETDPDGGAGARLGCGVITLKK